MNKHKQHNEIMTYLAAGVPVYLWGQHGTGKSFVVEQIAEELGLSFGYYAQINDEFELKGFILPDGTYQETLFYRYFKDGGLLLLDEIDASDPKTIIILNNAIANGSFTFPNGETVTKHKDFRVVASANTFAGAEFDYRYKRLELDAATLDRFSIINFTQDDELIENIVEKGVMHNYLAMKQLEEKVCVSMRSLTLWNKMMKHYEENDATIDEDGAWRLVKSLVIRNDEDYDLMKKAYDSKGWTLLDIAANGIPKQEPKPEPQAGSGKTGESYKDDFFWEGERQFNPWTGK